MTGAISGSNGVNFAGQGSTTVNGPITIGAGGMTVNGPGVFVLGTSGTITGTGGSLVVFGGTATINGSIGSITGGAVQVNGGKLVLAGTNTFVTPVAMGAGGTLVVANDYALSGLTAATAAAPAITLGATAGSVVDLATDGNELPMTVTGNHGFSSTFLSDTPFGTSGAGINQNVTSMALSGGTLNVQAGTGVTSGTASLSIGSVQLSSGNSGDISTFNPTSAVLTIGSIDATSNPQVTKSVELSGTSLGNSVTGSITNSGGRPLSLLKSGSGAWTIGGVNTYSGNTTISGGTLKF